MKDDSHKVGILKEKKLLSRRGTGTGQKIENQEKRGKFSKES